MSETQTVPQGVVLTDVAVSKVRSLLEAEGRTDLSLRIAVQPDGCSGLRYQLYFDDRELDGDIATEYGEVKVPTRLAQLCEAVQPQVEHVVLVDNGSSAETLAALQALVEGPSSARALLALGENRGIGAAQNAGIVLARQHGSRYVLLLDHDSIPEVGMVATLRAAIESQSAGSPPVAAAGPRYADACQITNPSPFVQLEGLTTDRKSVV